MELVRLLKKDKRRFAAALGVDVSTVYRWLSGSTSPTFEEILAVHRVTGDSAEEILYFFDDLIAEKPHRSSELAIKYIQGVRSLREWRKAFK